MVYQTEHFENRAGGKGWIHIEHLLPEEEKGMVKRIDATAGIEEIWPVLKEALSK